MAEHCNLCHEEHEIQRMEIGEMKIKTCPNIRRYGDGQWILPDLPCPVPCPVLRLDSEGDANK